MCELQMDTSWDTMRSLACRLFTGNSGPFVHATRQTN